MERIFAGGYFVVDFSVRMKQRSTTREGLQNPCGQPTPCGGTPPAATRAHFRLNRLWWLLLVSGTALAQQPGSVPAREDSLNSLILSLQKSHTLQQHAPAASQAQEKPPIHLEADRIHGTQDSTITLEGDAQLQQGPTFLRADRVEYESSDQQARAQGNVHINQAGDVYEGSDLDINLQTYQGYFQDVNYRLQENQAHGTAERVDFLGREELAVQQGNYTTCQRVEHDPDWEPAWQIHAKSLHIDRTNNVGTARGAVLEFQGVPLLPVPYLSFPVSDQRKSGFLPPTVGLDSVSGLQYEQPYYWNISPNRDAILSTSIMARRGVNVGGEFRYLERDFSGELSGSFMPDDRLRDRNRWSYAYKHRHDIAVPVGQMQANLNLNRVGDDNHWRDFPRTSHSLTDRLLSSEGQLQWSHQDVSVRLRALEWQTLQDPDSIITPPYDMLPQLNARYTPQQPLAGMDVYGELDTTRFRADDRYAVNLTDGDRSYALLRVSRPFLAPHGFVTPSLQVHASSYRLESTPLNPAGNHNRVIGTASIDSGLFFERETSFWGRNTIQTLEPRAFYTYTPYKDQSMLPLYDTAELDFTFASIYSPNAFVGNDRFADNNLLTLGANSKLIDPETGGEIARIGLAQRLRFKDQRVSAIGENVVTDRWSDILLGGAVNWSPRWSSNGVIQYNYKDRRSVRYTLSAQYQPGEYRSLSAGYRMKRDASKHIDVGWQWPLTAFWNSPDGEQAAIGRDRPRWYSVGRLNYSMRDKRLVDTIVGLEYDSCCWIGRVVLERLQNSYDTANTRLLFQIELVGLSRLSVGSNPLNALRSNVPGYQPLTGQSFGSGSRSDQYE